MTGVGPEQTVRTLPAKARRRQATSTGRSLSPVVSSQINPSPCHPGPWLRRPSPEALMPCPACAPPPGPGRTASQRGARRPARLPGDSRTGARAAGAEQRRRGQPLRGHVSTYGRISLGATPGRALPGRAYPGLDTDRRGPGRLPTSNRRRRRCRQQQMHRPDLMRRTQSNAARVRECVPSVMFATHKREARLSVCLVSGLSAGVALFHF